MDFQKIIAGMTGQQFMDVINGNFDSSKSQLNTIAANVLLRVIANNVKQLKVEKGQLFYTLDDTNWVQVNNNTWGSITGKIADQADLVEELNKRAPITSLEAIQKDVTSVKSDIDGVKTSVKNNTSSIDQNTKAVGALQKEIADKVSSPDIISFRIASSGFLQYSTDGVSWNNVQSVAEINWGSIGGEISNQIDLQEILRSKVKQSDFDNHLNNKENPHSVTKKQVGLEFADNTSDKDKPISDLQKAEFDSLKETLRELSNNKLDKSDDITAIEYISLTDYNTRKEEGSLLDTVIYIVD